MGESCAWVTLATNDSYCLGALVLAHSLKRASTAHSLVILVTPQVTPVMKERLSLVFKEVISVDVLDSGDAAHLALLARPELGITFTKLHCWSLTQYSKCVFLDADTLVLQNCDELFEREELSAAPDVGWPDCFNSGVFVYRPSSETFNSLIAYAKEKGSFDGGDQGLLNQYFSSWSTGDISKHLPFLYNVCSTSFYSYLPALKQYGSNMKIVHFIGALKPWLQSYNWESRSVNDSGSLQAPLQHWWDIFTNHVHPILDVAMGQRQCGAASPALYIPPPPHQPSPFPWHHLLPTPPHEQPQSAAHDFVDPWEHFTPAPPPPPHQHHRQEPPHHHRDPPHTPHMPHTQPSTERQGEERQEEENFHLLREYVEQMYTKKAWYEHYTPEEECQSETDNRDDRTDTMSQDDISICGPGGSHCGTTEYVETYSHPDNSSTESWHGCQHPITYDEEDVMEDAKENAAEESVAEEEQRAPVEEVRPRHPYDNFYLLHRTVMDQRGKRCSHEAPPTPSPPPTPPPPPCPPSPPPSPPHAPQDDQAGVAGALSQLTLGSSTQCPAVEEHLRRQGWEAGNIDYMGADAFDNIWAKIAQTLSGPTAEEPAPEADPIVAQQPAPEADPIVAQKPAPEADPIVAQQPASEADLIVAQQPALVVPQELAPIVAEKLDLVVAVELTPVPAAPVSKLVPVEEPLIDEPIESKETPAPPSSIESSIASTASTASSDSSASSASSARSVVSTDKDPQAMAEETGDNRQVEAGSGEITPPAVSASLPKQMEKLVCHLKPAFEVEQLLTPESEHEDAATIAQSIIASEEALYSHSPVITSATPPVSSPIAPTLPQNIRDLSVDTAIPETPPVPALVSLAQIGILPSKQPVQTPPKTPEPVVAESELKPKTPEPAIVEPKLQPKIPEPEPVIAESKLQPETPEPVTEPKLQPKIPEPEPVVAKPELQSKTPKPVAEPKLQPKTPEPEPAIAEPKLRPKTPEPAIVKPKLQPKTPEPAIVEPKLQPKTPEPVIAEPKLQPKTPEPEPVIAESKPEPEPELVLADPPKPKKMVKKVVKRVPKTPDPVDAAERPETKILVEIKSQAPKTPDAEPEHKLVCSIKTKEIPAQTLAEIVIPDDLESIKPIKLLKTPTKKTDSSEKSDLVSPKPIVEVDKKTAPEETATCQIKLKAVTKKTVTDALAPKVDISLKGDTVKGEEPSTPVTPGEEAPAKPKVKKMVKKVPATPKVKVEGDSEGADAPVPPPRKKIVKPKESI